MLLVVSIQQSCQLLPGHDHWALCAYQHFNVALVFLLVSVCSTASWLATWQPCCQVVGTTKRYKSDRPAHVSFTHVWITFECAPTWFHTNNVILIIVIFFSFFMLSSKGECFYCIFYNVILIIVIVVFLCAKQ